MTVLEIVRCRAAARMSVGEVTTINRPDPGPAAKDLLGAIDRSTMSIERFTIAVE